MNFDLSEDEEMLKALAERFIHDRYDMDRRRSYLASGHGFSAENWALLGELGLIAAGFALLVRTSTALMSRSSAARRAVRSGSAGRVRTLGVWSGWTRSCGGAWRRGSTCTG